jgi:hypothetical protein
MLDWLWQTTRCVAISDRTNTGPSGTFTDDTTP